LIVNTNVGSLNAQRSLAASGAELKTAMERLSSGKKINSAADDAAGFAIAERMTAQIRGLNMATKNANDGLSMLAVIENATNDVTDMLHRMRELAVQAANDTNGSQDRTFLQKEVAALIEEIDRVATQTQYNNQLVLNGFFNNKNIQVGTEAGQAIQFDIQSIKSSEIGIRDGFHKAETLGPIDGSSLTANGSHTVISLVSYVGAEDIIGHTLNHDNWFGSSWYPASPDFNNQSQTASIEFEDGASYSVLEFYPGGDQLQIDAELSIIQSKIGMEWKITGGGVSQVDVSSQAGVDQALNIITSAIEQVSGNRASYGALQNRLEYTVSNLMNVAEFTTSARSRIEDADFAAESARLAKAQVLQQTGTAMLAQANAQPQLALSLIR
jgi:flagellin